MNINIWGVILATLAQFAVGSLWYSVLFGKLWGQMHGFDKLSKEKQKEMASKMGPFYGLQLVLTAITVVALAKMLIVLPDYSPYMLGLVVWVGFIVPTQISAVVFGGTEPKWMFTKSAVMAGAALACTMAGVAVLQAFN